MAQKDDDSDEPIVDDNIIRIQLRKPHQRKWELRTRNLSPGIKFPTIQLFDCEGNLLVETNDENISIKSSDFDECSLRNTQSLREKDFRHVIDKKSLRKHNTISGDKIYTRIYRQPVMVKEDKPMSNEYFVIKQNNSITSIPSTMTVNSNPQLLRVNSYETSPFLSGISSEISSLKSSDNEMTEDCYDDVSCDLKYNKKDQGDKNSIEMYGTLNNVIENNEPKKSQSFSGNSEFNDRIFHSYLQRSTSDVSYNPPNKKISFLNTYLKSLPNRTGSKPDWLTQRQKTMDSLQNSRPPLVNNRSLKTISSKKTWRFGKNCNFSSDDLYNLPPNIAADYILKKRIMLYRRGISNIESRRRKESLSGHRRHSVSDMMRTVNTSSSESVDEADLVLSRLKRRILRNKMRDRHQGVERKRKSINRDISSGEGWQDVADREEPGRLRARQTMGSNISQHSSKGLKGRRARSSGDLCNGDTKSQSESSVCGSVVGDVMGWNRSLPNHLDGNRHLAEYSRVNNNYAEFVGTYRSHPKGGRGLRYRVSKSGSDAEPVWKLQDPGCDQGYGSERSPEEDCAPALQPAISLEEYEAQLRVVYPFINDDNTFTVVVEKDGRGLGMSVCGGGGLVRIRRLYPPQPAWRTGRLAQRDLLLAANGVPLAGLSTYEALEVLRTAAPRVELRVCRPPPDVLESVTPPEPPTPPARTPHPPHQPLDPLNCHPMHARLSATTSSATTSSSEGRGRRDGSPDDRRDLQLPGLDRPMPVYDVQYGEFDIIMTKVNGSLGFTLRKEDHSALGHYVRALVREPALSDGRIQPGDRIVAVNDTPMSNMSHSEAVAFLRACGSDVRLRLYRDHAATPLSPMSPKEDAPTDSDTPINKPKPPLRPEAVSMLCDLAARRLTPDAVDGSGSPCLSPRKFRKLTKENHYEQPNDRSSSKCTVDSHSPERRSESDHEGRQTPRTHSVQLASPTTGHTSRKQKLSLTVPPHGYELNNLNNEALDAPNFYQEDKCHQRYPEPIFNVDSNEPVSMPVDLSNDEARFKHTNPAYQSAVLHPTSSDGSNNDGQKDDGLKKWKGITLSPDNERKTIVKSSKAPEPVQKENIKPPPPKMEELNTEPTIVTVELNRGWNSRLGFSVQSHPESGQSYISAVYSDSVAARDGRLRQGDVILQVNDENVTSMKTPEVIDLLRILRGSICITVLRPPNPQ